MAPLRTIFSTLLLLPTLTLATSAVLDLLPSNFDSVVLSKETPKPALVEFFAPWCGHCKTLAPIYEELGTAFAPLSSKVTIAKVDADAEKALARRFSIQGFPTLKWFDGVSDEPEEYNGGRDLESLTSFIESKIGAKVKKAKTPDSAVTMLTDATFSNTIGKEKDVLVAFTAPWCGHCKTLAPVWEQLAAGFADEKDVLIAKVDADNENSKTTAMSQGIEGFPTIKFFPRGKSTGETYSGARSEAALVEYLNEKAGTQRVAGGGLNVKAGTVAALDGIVGLFTQGKRSLVETAEEVGKAAKGVKEQGAEYYVRVLGKMAKQEDYAKTEMARLEGMVKKGGLAREKVDEITRKINVLRNFAAQKVEQAGEKVKEGGEKMEVKDEL